ncbi:MAG: ATP synthase F1 subunit epsilon [Treponema sp.]|jgi:F-type H+-transporting ATPase subunit epsilon|nr:ATP synthase F1 subunit epsilon [Treponema sp.]
MSASFPFEVHTPYRLFYSGQVESVTLTLIDGEICVYTHHSPFTAPVTTGILRVKDDKGVLHQAFITEGILEVKDHKTVLMIDAAERPDEIDYERACDAKKRAEETLAEGMLKFEVDNAKASLKRAEMRIKAWELREKGSS